MNTSSLSGCVRHLPIQERGERRFESLLDAAVVEFAKVGYEAATMKAIAERAESPIGSLYQFFPNKEAVARAVRTRQIEDAEKLWAALDTDSLSHFVDQFVSLMVRFVDEHPAFLPLLDAPSSTLPVGPRNRLRKQMERLLLAIQPALPSGNEALIAEMVLTVNKALLGLYARSPVDTRSWILTDYRVLLSAFLSSKLSLDVTGSEEFNVKKKHDSSSWCRDRDR